MWDECAIVDDNKFDRLICRRIIERLREAGSIRDFDSSEDVLPFLNQECDTGKGILVFLDINMPIVDGFIFLYEFEKFNDLIKDRCKVVILSSSDNKRDIDKIVNNNHVIKFITKPLTEVALEEFKAHHL